MKKLLPLLLLLAAGRLPAAVIFDSGSGTQTDSGTISTISVNHTVGSGSLRYIICGVGQRYDATGGYNITGVTVGGVSMSLVDRTFKLFGAPTESVYGLVAPASGVQSVVATFSGTSGQYATLQCMSFRNVDQTTPLGTPVSSSTDVTNSDTVVGSAVGDIVTHFMFSTDPGWTVNSGGITPTGGQQFTFFGANSVGYGIYKDGAASTTTIGVSGPLATTSRVGVAIKADPSPPADPTLYGNFFL